MGILTEIFTWWNGQTVGTRLFTARKGQKVGEDEQGNKFYQTADGKRRWVIYNGVAEASRISPDWHGWMHHTYDEIPSQAPLPRKAWEKDHKENLTGTGGAYHPPGSVLTPASRPRVAGDYEAWQPE
ncbi:MAG TPA: NADH:ubiquinone oxidoreductase subunit NDUFA12 [Thermohalobaculum sp.]|nr:NADH:ubiquinone oxidoreductase subunit NDUFA12 [Thermohalobaculum sp.]